MLAGVAIREGFYRGDFLLDIFNFLVVLFILIYCVKFYLLNKKQKKYRYLITSFSFLTLSFLFKILTHVVIYYRTIIVKHIGIVTITYQTLRSSLAFVGWGVLVYRILSLLAFYIFYVAYVKEKSKLNVLLMIYLLLIAGYLSESAFYIYHLTSFFLIFLIVDRLYFVYTKNKLSNTKLLTLSFLIIMASQGLFIFVNLSPVFYIVAEIVQLVGYLFLLFTFIRVLRHGKKKRAA